MRAANHGTKDQKLNSFEHKLRLIPMACALLTLAYAAPLFLAWLFIPSLKEFASPLLKTNGTLGLTLASLSLWLLKDGPTDSSKTALATGHVFSAVALLIGAITGIEYLFDLNFGIDQLLTSDIANPENLALPGRMSPVSCFCLFLGGLGLSFINVPPNRRLHLGSLFTIPLVLLSLLAFLGYIYGEKNLYQFGPFIRVSWESAVCYNLLGIGILYARPRSGPIRVVTSQGLGGMMARRLFPIIIFVLITLGSAWLTIRRHDWVNRELSVALFVIAIISILVAVVGYISTQLDQQEKKGLIQLSESEARFRTITDAMPQMVWSALPNGLRDYYNKRWYESTGASPGSTDGEGWLMMIHPDDVPKIRAAWAHSIATGSSYEVEYRLRYQSGDYRWTLARALPVRNEKGEILRWMGTSTDIHDHKVIESRLNTALEDLREAVRSRDEFLSIASHELKTPLTSLKLQSQIFKRLAARGDESIYEKGEVDAMVDGTDKQTTRLTRLVDDMLDVARIRSGKLAIETEEFDLGDVVRETIDQLKNQFGASGKAIPQLELACAAEGTWDRLRIEQVVTNLFTNAIRYGEGKPVRVKIEDEGSRYLMSVQDHGIGISEEARDKIFDRFERAINANEVSGLGLGLFITKQIVLAHGGDIWVESEIGRGSTFGFSLPKNQGPSHSEDAGA